MLSETTLPTPLAIDPHSLEVERAEDRARRVFDALDAGAQGRLLRAAVAATGAAKRLIWLRRAVDTLGLAAERAGGLPCRRGCAHCCHIALMISRPEAQALAKATGRPMVEHPAGLVSASGLFAGLDPHAGLQAALAHQDQTVEKHNGEPCPFLDDRNECSAYADRPLACRLHFSLADDEGPCRVVDEDGALTGLKAVPYLDASRLKAASLCTIGLNHDMADVREWFAPSPGVADAPRAKAD